jgi:hypothetical protein
MSVAVDWHSRSQHGEGYGCAADLLLGVDGTLTGSVGKAVACTAEFQSLKFWMLKHGETLVLITDGDRGAEC